MRHLFKRIDSAPTVLTLLSLVWIPPAVAADVSLSWNPNAETNVSGYKIYYGTASGTYGKAIYVGKHTSYTVIGLDPGTYYFTVTAYNTKGKESGFSNEVSKSIVSGATLPPTSPSSPKVAYGFNEGSGTMTADSSGNSHTGTVTDATWTSGRFGYGLSFDGNDDLVISSYRQALGVITLSAWIKLNSFGERSRGSIVSKNGSDLVFMVDADGAGKANRALSFWRGHSSVNGYWLTPTSSLATGVWYHVAVVYSDSATAKAPAFYINGVLQPVVTESKPSGSVDTSTAEYVIGNGQNVGGSFDGIIDQFRIYDKALSQYEIQNDMNTAIGDTTKPPDKKPPDTKPPVISSIQVTGITSSAATITWSTDEQSDSQVDYGTTPSYGSSTSLNTNFTTSHSQKLSGLAPNKLYYYRVRSRDSAGNLSVSSRLSFTTLPSAVTDKVSPSVSITAPSNGSSVGGTVTVSANASDNVGVVGVQFLLNGASLGAEDTTAPFSISWNTTTVADGNSTLSAKARDAAGNSATAANVVVRVSNGTTAVSGLAAAYGFNEGKGTSTADGSGNGNTGIISGATWTTGRFGSALSFSGTKSYVSAGVKGMPSFDAQQTISCWLLVSSNPSATQTIISLAHSAGSIQLGFRDSKIGVWKKGGTFLVSATPPAPKAWHHYVYTFDRKTHRLYIDGVQKSTSTVTPQPGAPTSFEIGRWVAGTEFLKGVLDEVQIYKKTLSPAEILTRMNTPVDALLNLALSSFSGDSDSIEISFVFAPVLAPGEPKLVARNAAAPEIAPESSTTQPTATSKKMMSYVLPEIEDEGYTLLHVANPNSESATITFELTQADGTPRTRSAMRTVNANGSVAEFLTDLFPGVARVGSDYLRVTSNRVVFPFELLGKTGVYLEGLNGQDTREGGTIIYSPQYVVGGSDWRTTLSVVNLENAPAIVTFKFIRDDGTQIGTTQTRSISARGKIHITDQAFFINAGGTLTQGYVEITSSGPKLAGSVVFGDPGRSRFSSVLPLVSTALGSFVYRQLASDLVHFTGVAFVNPNDTAANATIDVYRANGELIITKTENIPARRRKSQLLTQYFPSLVGQHHSAGYIRITVDKSVASFALFGNHDLRALSAVVPQVVH